MRYPARFVSADPSVFRVGAVQVSVAEPVVVASPTVIANGANDALACPSDTLMTIFEYWPTCELVGVPDSRPVEVLNVAQDGRFWMLNVSAFPFGSLAVGVKLYAVPVRAVAGGVPLMTGGELPELDDLTVMVTAGSEALVVPSLTRITMFE
jgi:hypothetical protein